MNLAKRILSFLLALVLLIGNVPAAAFATEIETIPMEETAAATESVTEPAVEETVEPTQPETVPEETVAPTEAVTEPAEESNAPTEAETIQLVTGSGIVAPDPGLPDNDELAAAYAEQVLYGNQPATFGTAAGERLSGNARILYRALVPVIKKIANGERADAFIGAGQEVMFADNTTWIPDVEVAFEGTGLTEDDLGQMMYNVVEALLCDLPYEMYWYDKTAGCSYSYVLDEYGVLLHIIVTFTVVKSYQGTFYDNVDTDKTGTAAAAADEAHYIITSYASVSDYEKLCAYRDEICKLVSYNFDAANPANNTAYGDPWQLIYVFDGDKSTNVVCEGYSKAFMYLCDLTDFAGEVACYTVSGTMDGGNHMWNIVTIDGANYLVDLTNSDAGMIGQNGGMFLVGGAGSAAGGYTFLNTSYIYDDGTKSLWGTGADSILTLAAQDYEPNAGSEPDVDENIVASGTCGENLTWTLDTEGTLTISGTGEMDDWTNANQVWGDYAYENINVIVVEEGVTSIGDYAFADIRQQSVELPSTLTSIGDYAFWMCYSLDSVNIPENVTTIGEYAFCNCIKLTSIVIPDHVTSIGWGAFFSCESLNEITFEGDAPMFKTEADGSPATFELVTATAYYPANNPTWTADVMQNYGGTITWEAYGEVEDEPELPVISGDSFVVDFNGAEYLNYTFTPAEDGNYLFYFDTWGGIGFSVCKNDNEEWIECGSWENPETGDRGISTYLLAGVEYRIVVHDKYGEGRNETIYVTKAVPYDNIWIETEDSICYVDNKVYLKLRGTPEFALERAEWTVSDPSVLEIYNSDATNLHMYSLAPGTVTVTVTTESGKTATIELTVLDAPLSGTWGDNLTWVFDKSTGTLTLSGEGEMDSTLIRDTPWRNNFDQDIINLVISEGITNIGGSTFNTCVNLQNVQIPNSVTSIDWGAFGNCDSLTEISIPFSVTTIAGSAFEDCDGLVSITIPASVTTIGEHAFFRCIGLQSITFEGDAPVFETEENGSIYTFGVVTATAYYPANNPTWTADVMQNYGGTITWTPVGGTDENIVASGTCGENLTWKLNDEGTLTISGTGVMTDYAYKNFAPWYEHRSEIKAVTVKEGVTGIGAHAFRDCANLTEVMIADSVTGMGGNVFWNCTALTSIEFGSGLTKIPDAAFYKCSSLTSLEIPEGVTSIGVNAFQACTSLRTIYIPATVTSVPTKASACAFYDCDENLAIYCAHEAAPASWGEWNGDLSVSYGYTRSEYDYWTGFDKTATSVRIADGITRIPGKAFQNYTNLEDVYIPDSVTSIGSNAFAGCTGLRNIYIPASVSVISAEKYDAAPFYDCDDALQVYFGAAQEQDGWDDYWDCYASSTYHIAKHFGYTRAEYDYWMSVDKTVSSLTIPEGITKIPDFFFCGREYIRDTPLFGSNTTLKSVTIPATLTTIGEHAFEYCEALTKVTLAEGVECIGESAFLGCTALKNISIPASVKLVDFYAFDECSNLVIKYAGTMLEWVSVTESLLNAVCSDGTIVDYGSCGIGVSWLMDSKYVLTVFGEGSMTNYDYYWKVPWYDYTGYIKKVKILDGVNSIGTRTFYGCTKLTSVSIAETVANIEAYAFSKCTALKSITIPRSVNYIGVEAFYNNKALVTITFRHGVNDDLTIDLGAFVTFSKTKKTTVRVPNKAEINPSIKSYDWSADARKATYKSHYCDGNHYVVSENAIEPTCTQNGNSGKCYCEICGKVLEENAVVSALGHDVEQWEITRGETYTVAGERQGNCARCGELVVEEITALGLPKPVVTVTANEKTGGGTLTWEDDGEADYYEIYRATSKGGKFKSYKTVTEAYAEVDVKVGKTYYYKVKAICEADASHNSGYSNVVKVTGKCAQPEVTVEVKASTGKPVVKWSKVSGAEEYEIYRSTNATEGFKKIKTTSKNSYTDSKAVLGTTYYYKVKAIASKSKYDSMESAAKPCLTILAQPDAELSINKTTGKPVLAWEEVKGATGYEILRAESEKGEYTKLANQTELTFTDSTAEPDQDYWYKVNSIGASVELNSIDGDAEMIHATLAQPEVTFGINSITGKPVMTWDEVDGAVEYKIYRSSKSKESYKCIETTTEPEFTDTSASVGKAYYYKVIAIGENCKSAYSSYKKLTAKCAQPEITVETGATGKPYVDWDKVSGAEKYEVYRATAIDGTYKKVKTTTSTAYTDSKAELGMTYFYKVKAIASKSTYNSIESEAESCLTILAQPEVELTTNKTTGKPVLAWEEVKSAVSYQVYRSENGGEFERVFSTTELTYTDETAIIDSQYAYKVEAIAENTKLNNESAEVSIICACEKPKASIKLSSKKPSISWERVEGATEYHIYRSTKKSSGFKKIATVELEDGETYRDSKAKKGTTYYYKVVAVSENAKSAYSNTVKIKSK